MLIGVLLHHLPVRMDVIAAMLDRAPRCRRWSGVAVAWWLAPPPSAVLWPIDIMTTPTKITAAIALFAVTATATGAWYIRRAQLRELVSAAAAAEQVIEGWKADRAAVTDGLPSAHYRTPGVQRRAGARLRRAARVSLAAIDRAAARVRRVHVTAPPNAAVDVARDAYVDHLVQWEAHLAAIADDPDLALDVSPPLFLPSRRAARRAFAAALPPFADAMLTRRVEALLAR